jgi:chemotaxis protein CheD
MYVSNDPDDLLVVYGLGSCIAVCLYDPSAKIGGVLHALLPTSTENHTLTSSPSKFVNQGVPLLIDSMIALGAKPSRLTAKLCGGARMVITPGFDDALNIGERNIQAAKEALKAAGLKIQAQDTGGQTGRTIKFSIATGQVTIRSLGKKEQILG